MSRRSKRRAAKRAYIEASPQLVVVKPEADPNAPKRVPAVWRSRKRQPVVAAMIRRSEDAVIRLKAKQVVALANPNPYKSEPYVFEKARGKFMRKLERNAKFI